MKTLITLTLILLCFATMAQKAQVIEGEIVRTGRIPSVFTRPNGERVHGNYDLLPDSIHYVDGWRNVVAPAYDATTQRITNRHYDLTDDVVTWDVVDKTVEELAAEREAVLDALDNDMDLQAMKRLLQILTKSVLASDSVTNQELSDLATIYPQWRSDKAYSVNEIVVKDSVLYRVVQAHTSQSDWLPESTPALYTAYTPPGQIADFVQPTGEQDAYNIGDQVRFNGQVYESLIDANVWSPTAYPAGWQLVE